MTRIKGIEVIAEGYGCDNCHSLQHKKDRNKENEGYYIQPRGFERVTDFGHIYTNLEELYFCSKECLINWTEFGISHSTHQITLYYKGKIILKDPSP